MPEGAAARGSQVTSAQMLDRMKARLVSRWGQSTDKPEQAAPTYSHHLSESEARIVEEVRPFTLTGVDRVLATLDAVRYVVRRDVPGALVECGVWKGGSILAMIRVLQELGVDDRDIYLYDTFSGMTEPSELDTTQYGEPAAAEWGRSTSEGRTPWSWAFDEEAVSLESVRGLLLATGYPSHRLHFVVGDVEETLPQDPPPCVAVLRLDTDWYESTRAELFHLYPRLSPGGVLIIDDYGHWEGARRSVDEYFGGQASPILLGRIDYTGRMGIKW